MINFKNEMKIKFIILINKLNFKNYKFYLVMGIGPNPNPQFHLQFVSFFILFIILSY